MIRVVHPVSGSLIRILTLPMSRIPDPGLGLATLLIRAVMYLYLDVKILLSFQG
jgi:hypothetical protein